MDGLAIITGIAITSFLLLYMAFNLEKQHGFLKILTIFAAVFILLYIPQLTVDLDKDCAVLTDGSYKCFYSNGTAVTDYGEAKVGSNFLGAYLWYIRIFMIYVFVYYGDHVLQFASSVVPKRRWKK